MEVVCLNFRSYVNLPTLFACFLSFDVLTSSVNFDENVFVILVCISKYQYFNLILLYNIGLCVYRYTGVGSLVNVVYLTCQILYLRTS